MQLNLEIPLKTIDGSPSPEKTIGKIFAEVLCGETKGDALKYWGWAIKLTAGEPLELDTSDKETLKNLVRSHERMTVLIKAQILELLL